MLSLGIKLCTKIGPVHLHALTASFDQQSCVSIVLIAHMLEALRQLEELSEERVCLDQPDCRSAQPSRSSQWTSDEGTRARQAAVSADGWTLYSDHCMWNTLDLT